MKIKRRFTVYNILMLLTPILLIGVISVCFLMEFMMKYPVEDLQINRTALLNPSVFSQALGDFFQKNPAALQTVWIWAGLCVLVLVVCTTVFTALMSRSLTGPIADLTAAAESIRDGNLDFEVLGSQYDEINTLCTEFDNMRRELRRAARQEAAMKTERSMLLANLSHDLKTPVTSIRGYVDGIRDGVADSPDKVRRYLDTISAKAALIDEMVNNLSVFSKLELSKLQFSFETGDLSKFLAEVIDEYRLDLEKNDMELKESYTGTAVPVKLDYEKMGRVFANLIDNAVKYKKPGRGALFVSTYPGDGGIYAQISDNGLGIAQDELNAVFDEFYRADAARTPKIKGSGLGLGIARQIVERHGGKIWLRSDGEQTGTTAVIFLPGAAR